MAETKELYREWDEKHNDMMRISNQRQNLQEMQEDVLRLDDGRIIEQLVLQ